MSRLQPLLRYLRPYRRELRLGISSVFATAAVGLLNPLLIGWAIDALRHEITVATLAGYGALIVGTAFVQGLFQYHQRMTLVTMSRAVELDLRNDFFAHLERLEPAFYQRVYTGDLMARATNDLQAVRMVCGPAIMYGANTVFAGLGALALMLHIHPTLTLVSLATLPALAVVTKIFGTRIHVLFETVQADFSALSTRVQENLAGARVVRAYGREASEEAAYEGLSQRYVGSNRRLILWNAAFSPLLQGVIGLGFVAVLWYGGHLMLRSALTVGEFVSFSLFLGKLAWPMIAVGWVMNLVERGTASFGRIREILDREPAIRDEEPLAPPAPRGRIVFRDLDLTYPEATAPVLRAIELSVEPGSAVAVVGRTGSGKTSLLSLVPRLVDPPPGTLLVDGLDVRRWPLEALRRTIAMVPQESFLFSTTLGENVAFGRPEASRDEILEAVRLAGLDGDVGDFPKGLDTVVGERGITLSGGQKQRVALARALLRDPRILLLDDCLSAVDAETEERILRNLKRVFVGRTVLFVSHRVSAARTADTIVVLDDGRIAERGTHAELLAKGGLYADLRQRQMLEEALAAV